MYREMSNIITVLSEEIVSIYEYVSPHYFDLLSTTKRKAKETRLYEGNLRSLRMTLFRKKPSFCHY